MKLTQINPTPEVKVAKFNTGDFFLTEEGYLRQVIRIESGKYGIHRPDCGSLAINATKDSPQEIAQHYVNHNGAITRIAISEIVFEKTNEILNEEEL